MSSQRSKGYIPETSFERVFLWNLRRFQFGVGFRFKPAFGIRWRVEEHFRSYEGYFLFFSLALITYPRILKDKRSNAFWK